MAKDNKSSHWLDQVLDPSAPVPSSLDAATLFAEDVQSTLNVSLTNDAWPANVVPPSGIETLSAFTTFPRVLVQYGQEFVHQLTPFEKGLIDEPYVQDVTGALTRAMLFRWQLGAVLVLAPKEKGAPVHQTRMDELLKEGDAVLATLRAVPKDASPDVKQAYVGATDQVVRRAVALTETLRNLAPDEPRPAAAPRPRQSTAPQARLLSIETVERREREPMSGGQLVAGILLVLLVVGVGGWWTWNATTVTEDVALQLKMPDGANAQTQRDGSINVQLQTPVRPGDTDTLQELAKNEGRSLTEIGPGHFMLSASGAPAPAPVAAPPKPAPPAAAAPPAATAPVPAPASPPPAPAAGPEKH